MTSIKSILKYLPFNFRSKLIYLIFLICFSGVIEMAVIGSFIPLTNILMGSELEGFNLFGKEIHLQREKIFISSVVLIVFSGVLRYAAMNYQLKMGFNIGHIMAENVYLKIIEAQYDEINNKSKEYVQSIFINKIDFMVTNYILPIFFVTNAIFLLFMIALASLIIAPKAYILTLSVIIPVYILVIKRRRKGISERGEIVNNSVAKISELISDTSKFKADLIINNKRDYFYNIFKKTDSIYRESRAILQFSTVEPRFVIESIGIILILIIAYFSEALNTDVASIVALAVGFQRTLPAAQQIYNGWANARGAQYIVLDILDYIEMLNNEKELCSKINSKETSKEVLISFYNYVLKLKNGIVLANINGKLIKNRKYLILGKSGSGKTTFLKLISGLEMNQCEENIYFSKHLHIESKKNLYNICFYLQQDYSNLTIPLVELLTFPDKKPDLKKLEDSLEKSCAKEIFDKFKNSYIPFSLACREISGGERQRLMLARAFYSDKNILLLDEPTSALDNATSKKIVKNLIKLNKTIIVVSHDRSLQNYFDQLIDFKDKDLVI